MAPQVAGAMLDTQLVPQAWYPESQTIPQVPPPEHTALPFDGTGHTMQAEPHAPVSSSFLQVLPHLW
jgi:hypothetical protein